MLSVCCLEKYMAYPFLILGETKRKKTCFQTRFEGWPSGAFLGFLGCSTKPKASCSAGQWQKEEWSPQGLGDLTEGPWASVQWPGENPMLLATFLEGSKEQLSSKLETFSSWQYSGMYSCGCHHSSLNEKSVKPFNPDQLQRMLWRKTSGWGLRHQLWLMGERQLPSFLAQAASLSFSLYRVQVDLVGRGLWCGRSKKQLTASSWLTRSRGKGR